MVTHLQLAPEFTYYSLDETCVALVSEGGGVRVLAGAEWLALLEQLREACTVAALAAQLSERCPPSKTQRMIAYLQREGFVVEATPLVHAMSIYGPPGHPQDTLPASPSPVHVSLVALGTHDLGSVQRTLEVGGIICDATASLGVVVTDDYLHSDLAALNETRLHQQQPWVLLKPDGRQAWLGPLFMPGQGPCWQCFAARHHHRHQARRYVGRVTKDGALPVPPLLATPATRLAVLAWLPTLLERFTLTGMHAPMSTTIWTVNFRDGTWQSHTLVRRPQCPQCGDPTAAVPQPHLTLQPRCKQVTTDGGHRVVEPGHTLEQFRHHISPITGVVDALIPMHVDEHILCYRVVTGDTRRISTPRQLLLPPAIHDGGISWGKGLSHSQAQASALAEALERYTFMDERPPDYTRARLTELGAEAVDPRTLLHFSDAQYADTATRQAPHFERVPVQRFDPDQVIGWTAGWSLTEHRRRLVPSDFCWMTPRRTRDADCCHPDSNGCAAGNTLEEAILQGLLELIERDSVALWWYNRIPRPAIDLASVADAQLARLRQHYREAWERDLWVLDVTADSGIPVFVAVSALRHSATPEFVIGFGCHLDPTIALRRAVTEMGLIMASWQPFLTTRTQPDPWSQGAEGCLPAVEHWLRHTRREAQPHVLPSTGIPPRCGDDLSDVSTLDILADLHWCVERLASLGIEVIAVNLTRPDIGMPVVRVVAPGLRHFWRQLGPGRLYDVPVRLGWLDRPRTERDMNPLAMVI